MSEVRDPHKAVEYILRNAKAHAKAKAERNYLEEYRKSLKAMLMKQCLETAIGAQEREAYAHEEYQQHLMAIREAVQKEEFLRWKMVAAEAMIEVWRSQEATKRMDYKGTI